MTHVDPNQRNQHTQRTRHTKPLHTTKPVSKTQHTAATDTLSRSQENDSFVMPAKGQISSRFGMRVHPISHTPKFHKGIDIAAPMGSPVQSAKGGRVVSAGYEGGYGNCVVIDHGNGVQTRYAHLSQINVRPGDTVQTGQQIGKVGSTGASTGPHLHFEVSQNGRPVDPEAIIKGEAPLSAPPDPDCAFGGGSAQGGYCSPSRSGGSHASGVNASSATRHLSASAPANRTELLNRLAAYGITEDWLKKLFEEMDIPPEKMEEMMNLVLSVIQQESGGDANARSGVGAIGLMQLMPGTAAELGVNPNDPQDNVRGGVKYLMQMLDRFGGDATKAVAAYNAGPGAVEKYGGVPPFAETQNYVQKVLGSAA